MLIEYIQAALRRARYRILAEDGTYYGEITKCGGVWAQAATLEDCREELREVLEGWVILGLRKGLPLPVFDRIRLARKEQRPSQGLREHSAERRKRIVGNIAHSFEEAEAWDLAFWQSQSPQDRLSALVAIHRDIEKVKGRQPAPSESRHPERSPLPRAKRRTSQGSNPK